MRENRGKTRGGRMLNPALEVAMSYTCNSYLGNFRLPARTALNIWGSGAETINIF